MARPMNQSSPVDWKRENFAQLFLDNTSPSPQRESLARTSVKFVFGSLPNQRGTVSSQTWAFDSTQSHFFDITLYSMQEWDWSYGSLYDHVKWYPAR